VKQEITFHVLAGMQVGVVAPKEAGETEQMIPLSSKGVAKERRKV